MKVNVTIPLYGGGTAQRLELTRTGFNTIRVKAYGDELTADFECKLRELANALEVLLRQEWRMG